MKWKSLFLKLSACFLFSLSSCVLLLSHSVSAVSVTPSYMNIDRTNISTGAKDYVNIPDRYTALLNSSYIGDQWFMEFTLPQSIDGSVSFSFDYSVTFRSAGANGNLGWGVFSRGSYCEALSNYMQGDGQITCDVHIDYGSTFYYTISGTVLYKPATRPSGNNIVGIKLGSSDKPLFYPTSGNFHILNPIYFNAFSVTNVKVYTDPNDALLKEQLAILGTIAGQNSQIINQNNQIIDQNNKQNDILQGTHDFITDSSTPNPGDIATSDSLPSVGMLPPGPLDSILLLPLNIMNSITSSLGGSCTPIVAPLPFVGKNIEFPCFGDTIYKGEFAPLSNLVGVVASAFILYGYLKHLYKKVDRATSLESNDEDEWGVL